ncbi:uncharacterized protein LOC125544454 isoform X1 [Triticum urartu]|uniref:uncharacterized protein LOC125544454 isoform X1 n=1 Tax=Triticum urartu TaxID=4572 RepID=UPI002042F78C|nr:uncharacterized protein LOC125544454 isoform X1 [Triticum urartu]
MGTRSKELAARLTAGGPGGVGRPAGRGCGEGQHERVVALREIKNQTFGNQTKKLLYLTARHQPCSSMSGRGGELCLWRRRWRACRACCWSRGAPYMAPRPPRQQGFAVAPPRPARTQAHEDCCRFGGHGSCHSQRVRERT